MRDNTAARQTAIGNSLAIPHVRDMGTKIIAALTDGVVETHYSLAA